MSNAAKFPPNWPLSPGSGYVLFDKLDNGRWVQWCHTERSAKIMKIRSNAEVSQWDQNLGIEHVPPFDYLDDVSYFTQYPHQDPK